MHRALRIVVPVCAAIFVASIVIANTVYGGGKEMPGVMWFVLVPVGLLACGAIAIAGLGVMVATRRRSGG